MDKNTVYGLLIMAALFFAFMYFSPRDEAPAAGDKAATADSRGATQAEALPVPLTSTELDWLRTNIRDTGKATAGSDGTTLYTLSNGGVSLTLAGDSVYGDVAVEGRRYSYAAVTTGEGVGSADRAKGLDMIRALSENLGRYGRLAPYLAGRDTTLALENDVMRLRLQSKSGSITYAELKDYDTEYNADETVRTRRKVVLFDGSSNSFSFDVPTAQPVSTADLYFKAERLNDSTVLMSLPLEGGAYWGIRYTLPRKGYVVKVDIVQKGASQLRSNNRTLGFHWHQNLARQEKGRTFEERQSGLYYKFAGGSVENLSDSKNDKKERKAKIRWIGYKNQFFSSVMIARKPFDMVDFDSEVLKGSDYLKSFTSTATVNDYDWQSATPASFDLFLGPNLYPLLSHLDKSVDAGEDLSLTRLIPLGWTLFRWINTWVVIPVFTFLGSFPGMNYGIVILILTVLIKIVLFPLTYKSLISQAKMRVLAPDIKAINDKYPGTENAMLRQQKTMALYNKAGASPMSGCLPMLLQMPILFAMFSFFPSCIELRGQSFLWAHDLSAPDAIISWSGNIPLVTEYFGNHVSLFCLLMTVVNIIYTYTNMQSQSNSMPGMKWMMYLMPVFFLVFFNNYAAGLSYYYFLSLLITIVMTFAFRRVVKEEDVRRQMAENAKKPRKKSGFMARLEEMQKQQQEMMRQQQKQKGNRR